MNKHTFVVRVARDALGHLVGQISDPIEGWRRPFASPEELWRLLSAGQEGEQKKTGCEQSLPSDGTL